MAKKKNNKSKQVAKEVPAQDVDANKTVESTDEKADAEQNGDAPAIEDAVEESEISVLPPDDAKVEDEQPKEPVKEDINDDTEITIETNDKEARKEPISEQEEESQSSPMISEVVLEKPMIQAPTAEPTPESTTEPTPEPVSEPSSEAKVPKKRLTLQERLALAAKSKGKGKRNASGASITEEKKKVPVTTTEGNTRESSVEPSDESKAADLPSQISSIPSSREPSIDIKRPEPVTLFPKDFKSLPTEELHKLISDAENKFLGVESKNETLTIEKQSLQEKIRNISASVSAPSSSASQQLIKEKDEKIAQLLKEGENLSMKELKYTNTIKKLKSTELTQEKEIQRLTTRVEILEEEKKSSKEEIKTLKESDQQSSNRVKTLEIQLNNEKESLQEEISRNKELSKKIEELSQILIQEKNHASNKHNELKRSLDKEKNKLQNVQEENMAEVARLERKIEQLRFQSENALAITGTEDESYLKLIRQHDTLQSQYTSATENWQSIEASLMSKISSLENDVHTAKDHLSKSQQKNEILTNDLTSKTDAIEKLELELKKLKSEHALLKTKCDTLDKAAKELHDTLEGKEIGFGKERAAFEYKIQSLEKQFRDSIQPQQLTIPRSNSVDFSPQVGFNSSTPSFKRGNSWEIGLGESSTTPRQSRKSSAMFIPTYNQANESFDETAEINSDYDNDTVNSPVSAYQNGSKFENTSSSALHGGSSVQLLGKLSSQIRRLEIEGTTKDEELQKLSSDMKDANEEIVRLMKDNESVQNYKNKIEELEGKVDSLTSRYEKALEILGEKSEQVEELKADIQDWKDLCRQQVQQLADRAA